jgi:hypothetical protein
MSNGTNLAGELRTAISTIRTKTSEVSNSSFLEQVKGSRVDSARNQIKFAEGSVLRNQSLLDTILSKLNPPPTKEVSAGKSGTKTVVDEDEKRRLEAQKGNTEAQLNDAKGQVATAQQEADIASQEALSQSGITKDLLTNIQSLMVKADAIKEGLAKGETVEEKDVKSLIKGLGETMEKIDKPSPAVRDAFLKPMEEKLNEILKLVQENPQLVKKASESGESNGNNSTNTENQEGRNSETATTG